MGRGALVVFEGLDRSGKTTQTRLCLEKLSAAGVPLARDVPWRFPDRTTPIGQMLDGYLKRSAEVGDEAAHLLFSANRWEKAATIREALARGETIVYDRYAYSGVAYSVAKGLGMEWCLCADAGLPAADVVVLLEVGVETVGGRAGWGEERFEESGMQRRVGGAFERLKGEQWRVVDAAGTEAEVHQRVMAAVWPAVERARADGAPPAGSLWEAGGNNE